MERERECVTSEHDEGPLGSGKDPVSTMVVPQGNFSPEIA